MALQRYSKSSLLILLLQVLSWSSSSPSNSSCTRSILLAQEEQQRGAGGRSERSSNESWISYDCHVRTLNSLELLNATTSFILSSDIPRTRSIRIHCNDKLFFQSFLFPNETFFPGLSLVSVAQLSIDSCKIRRLEGGSNFWKNLPFLRTLSIQSRNSQWSSSVTLELFPNSFQGLPLLQTFDLTLNNIWTLPEDILCPLKSLRTLNISQNKLSEIEEISNLKSPGKVCTLPELETVDISHNALRQISAISKGWASVKNLLLGNNFIDQVQDEAFGHLEKLTVLNLNSNRLVALPPFLFKVNRRLRELYVGNNSISALSSNVFLSLSELQVLDLSRNLLSSQWIEVLAPGVFSGLGGLRVFDLSYNRLSVLDGRGLEGLGILRQLYLDHNVIHGLAEKSLQNCSELQDLGLAGNLLQEVPLTLRGLTLLRSLDLGENRISQVTNSSFEGLDQLYGLRMVDNRLTELPSNFCTHLKKLRVLNLAQNRLSRIAPSALQSCTELRALRLDSNSLENLPPLITPTAPSSLLWLNVSTNKIHSAQYHLLPPTLEWLDLSHNLLEDFAPPRQTRPPHLRVLDISYNNLKFLNFENLPPKLETVRANYNQLENIVIRPSLLASLRRVELVSNKLTSLPDLVTLTGVKTRNSRARAPDFFLGGNPFNCDCTLEWLHVPNNIIRAVDLDAISCAPIYPNSSAQALLSLSAVSDFLCPFSSHCEPSCNCCDFDACDCAMVCPENCECFHDQSWSRTVVNCAARNYSSIPTRIPMNTSELFLDGNAFPTLARHVFIGRRALRILNLNSSRVELISNKTFNGLKSLEILRLEQNLLTALHGYEFADLDNLRELYLQNNFLGFIAPHTFQPLKLLRTLRLDGNLIVSLNFQSIFNSQSLLSRFLFSRNHWTCECDFINRLRSWVAARSANLVTDFNQAHCKLHGAGGNDQNPLIASKCFLSNDDFPNKLAPPFSNIAPNLFLPFPALPNSGGQNRAGGQFSNGSPYSNGNPFPNSNQFSSGTQFSHGNPNGQFPIDPTSSVYSSSSGNHGSHSPSTKNNNQVANPVPGASPNQLSPLLANAASSNYLPSPLDGLKFDSASSPGLLWTIVLTSVGLIMLILVVGVIFRREIYYRLNDRLNFCWCGEICTGVRQMGKKWWLRSGRPEDEENGGRMYSEDSEKLFDAYFLYSKKDEELVNEKIVPELERTSGEENLLRLCLHYRDLCLSPGNPWNPEMVMSASEASKRLVLVLSRSFLSNEYTSEDLQNLLHSVLGRFAKKTIVVLLPCLSVETWESTGLGGIFNQQGVAIRRARLRSGVLIWTDAEFWGRFRLLLPKPSNGGGFGLNTGAIPGNFGTTFGNNVVSLGTTSASLCHSGGHFGNSGNQFPGSGYNFGQNSAPACNCGNNCDGSGNNYGGSGHNCGNNRSNSGISGSHCGNNDSKASTNYSSSCDRGRNCGKNGVTCGNSGSVRISTWSQNSVPRSYVTASNFNLLQPPSHIKNSALVLTPPPPIPLHLDLPAIPTRVRQALPNLPICSHSCIANGRGAYYQPEHLYSTLSASSVRSPVVAVADKGVKCQDNVRPSLPNNDHCVISNAAPPSNSLNLQSFGSEMKRPRQQFSGNSPDLVIETSHLGMDSRGSKILGQWYLYRHYWANGTPNDTPAGQCYFHRYETGPELNLDLYSNVRNIREGSLRKSDHNLRLSRKEQGSRS
ncbi:unnamed protein product [Allacma fusca]|uniref:TIR domain-containing protein n=1 Tax=Allacma fusca TaxID=39272 RepID=A0A8J2KSB1_9HEXA|nr:unnamed protein product [Allacma fusca]